MNLFICVSIVVFLAYPAFSINSSVPWQNQKSAREINEAINNMPHNESKKKKCLTYTGSPLIGRFLGPRKPRIDINPSY